MLVWASQHRNLRLRDIAAELVLTGELVGPHELDQLRPDFESTSCASAAQAQSWSPAPGATAGEPGPS